MKDITGREYIYGIAQDRNGAPYLFNIGELVRCKDCKHYKKINPKAKSGICYKGIVASARNDDGFCSMGERREDGEA